MLGQDDCSIFLAYAEQMEHPDRKKEEFGEKGVVSKMDTDKHW